jgi:uncharacterized coiled-coil protein SlyX
MAKWGEVKCPRCEEHAALVEKAKKVQSSYWKEDGTLFTDQTVVPGLLKRLEELEGKLAQQDSLWEAFKDRWTGERKYALRIIVKYLKGEQDAVDTPTDPDERGGS